MPLYTMDIILLILILVLVAILWDRIGAVGAAVLAGLAVIGGADCSCCDDCGPGCDGSCCGRCGCERSEDRIGGERSEDRIDERSEDRIGGCGCGCAGRIGGSAEPLRGPSDRAEDDAASRVCGRVAELVRMFLGEVFTPDLARKMEETAEDIAHDVGDPAKLKGITRDLVLSKLILDTCLHYYIYNKQPNRYCRDILVANVAMLKSSTGGDGCLSREAIEGVIATVKNLLDGTKDEAKTDKINARETYRAERISVLARAADIKTSDSTEALRDELSRRNAEVRELREKLSRQDSAAGVSRLSADLRLEECREERRVLQDKVYELRRDIEHLRNARSTVAVVESAALGGQVSALRARNAQLEMEIARLQAAAGAGAGADAENMRLRAELHECKKVLDDVLNAA